MNKTELIDAIASQSGLTKANAGKALDAILSSIQEALKKNDTIQLVGFGTYSVDERAEREGRNPRTGETMTIAAKKVVKFKPSKNILD